MFDDHYQKLHIWLNYIIYIIRCVEIHNVNWVCMCVDDDRRKKYVRDSESRYWDHMTPACMTEESDSENAEKIVTHQLLWRSECESITE